MGSALRAWVGSAAMFERYVFSLDRGTEGDNGGLPCDHRWRPFDIPAEIGIKSDP